MKKIFILLLLILSFALVNTAQAGVISSGVDTFGQAVYGTTATPLPITIAKIINALLGLLGIVAVAMLVYAGFLYMTSQGKEDVIKKAKSILFTSAIGLVIILSAYAIANFVTNIIVNSTGYTDDGGGGDDNGTVLPPPSGGT